MLKIENAQNISFLVHDSLRANGKKLEQYMRRRDRRHPWNWLERRLLLHFSENFAVVLDILTVEYTHNIRSMSVKLICIYIHYKTCLTMRLFNPIWKIFSWTSHLFDRKELWFLPPKQKWPPRNNWNIVDHVALFPVPIYDHPVNSEYW